NNFWTYQMLHVTQLGPLAASLIVIPTAVKAGQLTTAIAKVTDSEGAPVSGASVSFWIGGSQVGSGTTGPAGNVSAAVIAPVATATAAGYLEGSGSTTVVGEQRVGTVEPRVTAGLDTSTIIVAVLALVVIGALAAMMGRRK